MNKSEFRQYVLEQQQKRKTIAMDLYKQYLLNNTVYVCNDGFVSQVFQQKPELYTKKDKHYIKKVFGLDVKIKKFKIISMSEVIK